MFKTVSLASLALAASATFASANINDISDFVMEQDRGSQVELGTVRATGNGVVEIYSFHKGELGTLLGSEEVVAGVNSQVDVDIARPGTDAIALLKVGGEIVDTQEIDFN